MAETEAALEPASAPPAAPSPASASNRGAWSLSSGISFSRGDYGEVVDTEVVSVPVSLRYRRGNWRFKVTLPWVHISGPGSLIQTPEGRDSGSGGDDFGGSQTSSNSGSGSSGSGTSGSGSSGSGSSGSGSSGSGSSGSGSSGSGSSGSSGSGSSGSGSSGTSGGVITPITGLSDNRRSGIGDVSVSLSYSLGLDEGFFLDVTGKVKVPTASRAKRLGTGQVDFIASADLIKDVGPASFYLTGRRRFAGKPAGSTIRSVWGAGGGASLRAGPGVTLGADYNWQQSSFASRPGSSEVTGWSYLRLSRNLGLTVYAGTGLNTASADFLGGATLTMRF